MTRNINNRYIKRVVHLARYSILFLLCIALVAAIVPLSPGMPSPGLDGSWVYALGEGIARKLVFGKDLIFTLGPYSSIYTSSYDPATYHFVLLGSVYMAIGFITLLLFLLRNRSLFLSALLIFFLSCNTGASDATLLVYPLFLFLFVYRATLSNNDPDKLTFNNRKFLQLIVFFLFGILGLIPLIKGSLLLLAGAIGVLCVMRFYLTDNYRLAVISVVASLFSLLIFWAITGQPLHGLFYYFANMLPIVAGYTEAMSAKGKVSQISIYLIVWLLSVFTIIIARSLTWRNKAYLLLAFGLFLFIAFKEGFVRHDAHAAIAGSALFLAGVSLCMVLKGYRQLPALILFILSWFSICNAYYTISPASIATQAHNVYMRLGNGLVARLRGGNELNAEFEAARNHIRQEHPIPTLHGSTDIYPFDQSYLLASTNKWSPRPVFQSYTAYTPKLAEMNRAHLLGPSSPDNIIFSVQPIDERLPTLDDGPSWPIFADLYKPVRYDNGFVYLTKREGNVHVPDMTLLSTQDHELGEIVRLPNSVNALFAEIHMKKTLRERLQSIVFKPVTLRITLNLLDGSSRQYRFVPGMGDAGFILSPLIEDTTDFLLSYGTGRYLENKRVTSLKITALSKHDSGWNGYTLTLHELPSQEPADISSLIGIVKPTRKTNLNGTMLQQSDCFGSIDSINGSPTTSLTTSYSTLLSIQGWIAEAQDNLGEDDFFITLITSDGAIYVAPVVRHKRADVAAYFKSEALENSGFRSFVDVNGFNGPVAIGLARNVSGALVACRHYHYVITLNK